MSRSRIAALIVLLALAGYDFGFQPQRLVASFKAMRCCTEHCKKPRPVSAAERCCGVAEDQASLRAVHAGAPDFDAVADLPLPGPAVSLTPAFSAAPLITLGVPSRSPPIFLSKQSFLL